MNLIDSVTDGIGYRLKSESSDWKYSLWLENTEDFEYLHLEMRCDKPQLPPETEVSWNIPSVDIAGIWHPETSTSRTVIKEYFMPPCITSANTSAPVWCMFSQSQNSRYTFALSDAENIITFYNTLNEEDYTFACGIRLFTCPQGERESYTLTLRVDKRAVPYYTAISSVSEWWESFYKPLEAPDVCFEPLYSTWYSFHQAVNSDGVEKQCRLSRQIGCGSEKKKHGWQTPGVNVGYTDCGDWILCNEKFPDMAAHVERIHKLGMKYMLWFPLPFIASKSRAFERFKDKTLPYRRNLSGTSLLDPRYPEVREYLISSCIRFVRDWNLDGLKLDFVDQFRQPVNEEPDDRRDFASVPQALCVLLDSLISKLKAIKPEIMVEFRQMYLGPVMRRYGNMFRAGDCADDILLNRVRTTDIRLISGSSSVHSDMLSWHRHESPEIAARQILNVIFSVPQISVDLEEISASQKKMLDFWLGFAKRHKELLLKGSFRPQYPQLLYPLIYAERDGCMAAAVYMPAAVRLTAAKRVYIINASDISEVFIDTADAPDGICRVTVCDCFGETVYSKALTLSKIEVVKVPVSGLIHLTFENV